MNIIFPAMGTRGGGSGGGTPAAIILLAVFSAIGGFLFGYDTGVVSGAMILVRDEFELSTVWHELIVSSTIGAAWLAALAAGPATDRFGRRPVILVASVVFTVGAVVMGAAPEKVTLLIGRIIVGLGIGMASMSVPVYLSESSPADLRGRITVTNNIFITGGQLIASVICGAFSKVPQGWRYMLGLAALPSVVQLMGFAFMPESPRWLILKGRLEEARQVLQKIRPADADIDGEVEAIMDAASNDVEEGNIAKVFQSAPVRRALFIGCLLQLFQQISGINTVMYYSASIISMAGVRDQSQAIWLAAATSSVNFFGTFIGLWLVERVGRRSLTLGSLLGSTASLLVLALSFQMAYIHSPDVLVPSTTDDCQASNCGVCTSRSECGFCFIGEVSNITNSSCVAADHSAFNEMSVSGVCANKTILEDDFAVFAYDWCPYQYAWISILGLGLYLAFFSPGMGPMPWTINSEIYPGWARSTCTSITTAVNWASNLLVSLTFLTLTEVLLKHGAFYLYMVLAAVGFLTFYFILPETRGVPLENMERLFSKPFCSRQRRERTNT
ncbi:proton myo-inositol cotransporter isoform X3 [Penaeus vannamei]|uniref:proton myo-inositol cotransporter isoform X3 n=1 Tax=Penaeus vannamei TaxID=6689 RepID=UPI00387F5596